MHLKVFFVVILEAVTVCFIGAQAPLTQRTMSLNDPRMPPDRFDGSGRLTEYWLGTHAPELPADQICVFQTSPKLKTLVIDGKRVIIPDYQTCNLFLAPGKHTINFSYHATASMPRRNSMGLETMDSDTVYIDFPFRTMELIMIPGQLYTIEHDVKDATFDGGNFGYKLGYGQNTYTAVVFPQNRRISAYTPPALQQGGYLEPYDPSLPFEKQAFLEASGDVYVTEFNGEKVWWNGTIGIPEGNHTLQIERSNIPSVSITIKCLPGHRYVLSYTEKVLPTKKILYDGDIEKSIMVTGVTGDMGVPVKVVVQLLQEDKMKHMLFGYNFIWGMPLGFSIGVGDQDQDMPVDVFTSWNFIVADDEKSGFEWTFGFSYPAVKYFSLVIAGGANHTKTKSTNDWQHAFVMEAGGIIYISTFYLSGTYRLSDFKNSGFAAGVGIRFE